MVRAPVAFLAGLLMGLFVLTSLASAQRRDPNLGRLDRFPDFVNQGGVLSPWPPSAREQRAMRALRRRARAIAACVDRRDGHPVFTIAPGEPRTVEAPYPEEATCLARAIEPARGLPTDGRFQMILNFRGETPVGIYAREITHRADQGGRPAEPRYACDVTPSSVASPVRRRARSGQFPDFEGMRRHAVITHRRDAVAAQACRGIDTTRVLDPWGSQMSAADREWTSRVQSRAAAIRGCVPRGERPPSWSLPYHVTIGASAPTVVAQAEASEASAACIARAIAELRGDAPAEGTLHVSYGERPAGVYLDVDEPR